MTESGGQPTGRDVLMPVLVDRILAAGARRVAVDGVDGAGKTIFADALTRALVDRGVGVAPVSFDDFHHPREARYRLGRESPEGFWLDSHDHDTLRREVLEPFAPDGSRRYRPAAHDLVTDEAVHGGWTVAEAGTVLVVEGIFLHRNELADCWDFSIFLDVPFTETARRMASRDGTHPDPEDPSIRRYVEGQRIYFRECAPLDRATVVIDNTDPSAPRIVPG